MCMCPSYIYLVEGREDVMVTIRWNVASMDEKCGWGLFPS